MINNKPELIEVNDFTVSGLSVRTINSDEFNQETAKLPQLWNEFFANGMADKISNRRPESPIFGVYSNYASNETDFYTVTAGVSIEPGEINPELNVVNLEGGHYLVFKEKGMMPQIIINTWQRIWSYFADNVEYKRRFGTDFEAYLSSDEIAIYIGVSRDC